MKIKKLLAVLLAVGVIFTGCGGSGSTDGGNDTNTLTIAIQDEIEGTDIQQIGWENIVQALIYEPLVTFSPDLSEIQPCFAESYEVSEDGLAITFKLYSDAKFGNGDPLTAESVKKSVERMKEISEYAGDVEAIKEIQVIDETTVKYILSQPAPYMWASLASTYGGVVDVDKANEMGKDDFNRQAVGNGPFNVKEWQAGSQITLEKNQYYKTSNPNVKNKGLMNFDEIVIRFIPDEFTRVSELESGSVDVIYDVPSSSVQDLKDNADITMHEFKQAGVTYSLFQTDKGATQDIRVRQAINYALNREEISTTLNGVVTPIYGFISDAQAGFSAEKEAMLAKEYAYNPEKAKSLLAEAGYKDADGDGILDKDGKPLTIEYSSPTDKACQKDAAPVIQSQLKAVGIDLQIREFEAAYIKQTIKDNDYQMAGRTYQWNDADIMYYVFTEESGYPWHDATVTKLLTEARYITDPAARVKGYEAAQDALFAKMPAVPLFEENYYVAAKSNIKGLQITSDGRSFYNDVTKE